MNRGILATCYARPARRRRRRRRPRCSTRCARPTPTSRSSSSSTARRRRRPRSAPTPPTSRPATTSAPATSSRSARHRQPHQGRVRRRRAVGQRRPRPRRDRRPPARRRRAVSATVRGRRCTRWRHRSSVAGRAPSPTSSSRRCRTSAASPARRSSSSTAATPSPARPTHDALDLFAEDIVLMRLVGMRPVVVHGGGPQISALMARLGKTTEFRDGLRVTDAETVDIARMVLIGQVNPQLVTAINLHGNYAVGVSGEDAGLIRAAARDPELGFVGDVDGDQPGDPRGPARRRVHPGRRHDRHRRAGPGVQHQRRRRRRRDRRGARRREAGLPHRHRGPAPRRRRPGQPDPPDDGRRARRADRRRHDRRRDDPQGRRAASRPCATASAGPHPRRPHRPRAAARDLHRRRHRHDGARHASTDDGGPP